MFVFTCALALEWVESCDGWWKRAALFTATASIACECSLQEHDDDGGDDQCIPDAHGCGCESGYESEWRLLEWFVGGD